MSQNGLLKCGPVLQLNYIISVNSRFLYTNNECHITTSAFIDLKLQMRKVICRGAVKAVIMAI